MNNLQDLASDRGLTIDTSPDDLARIATEVVHREFYPESVYDTLRALMRIQRQMRAHCQWAAVVAT
ncbi:hypothetical protein BKG86_17000 [Mycobacteroides chelonae]|uniref:hypothetical protein n=1 Tax=Mycobacteroides chelonae TaxID=1774 RepID=UPI0008AA02BC|nr:hypothetical protein [Mycobacteroides chelonae]OHU71352.1 hypothetical protein BKG86_17000 [Mycobacteroides chelonae]